MSDAGLAAIATLIKLEKLIVSYMYQITDKGLKNMCGLKELECRKCPFSDWGMTTFIESSPQLQLLDLSGCWNIKDTTLEVAKDACSSRTNNIMLKMIIGGSGILAMKKIDRKEIVRLPPLLHIVNVDLSDISSNVSNVYFVDLHSWYDRDSDYTEYSDYIEYSDYTEYSEDDYRKPDRSLSI